MEGVYGRKAFWLNRNENTEVECTVLGIAQEGEHGGLIPIFIVETLDGKVHTSWVGNFRFYPKFNQFRVK